MNITFKLSKPALNRCFLWAYRAWTRFHVILPAMQRCLIRLGELSTPSSSLQKLGCAERHRALRLSIISIWIYKTNMAAETGN